MTRGDPALCHPEALVQATRCRSTPRARGAPAGLRQGYAREGGAKSAVNFLSVRIRLKSGSKSAD